MHYSGSSVWGMAETATVGLARNGGRRNHLIVCKSLNSQNYYIQLYLYPKPKLIDTTEA